MSSPAQSPAIAPPRASREPGRKDPALLHAHAAMRSMLEQGLSPTPANYLVWFSFHSGAAASLRPVLDSEINASASSGERIPQTRMDALYAQFFAAEREAISLQQMASRLEGAVTEAIKLVNGAREDALTYGGTLGQAAGRLASDPTSLTILLHQLVEETREVSRRSEAASRNLAETSRKTQALQSELTEARHQACTDPLTGLANRRQLDEALQDALAEAAPLALVMLDLDHFKAVNDTHGHPAGDQVLRHLADMLTDSVSGRDLAVRFGGEEFTLLLRQGTLREAIQLAERIRARLANSSVLVRQTGSRISVTASLGIAMALPGESAAHLIERADAALYEAKRGGRNRICTDPPLPKAENVWN